MKKHAIILAAVIPTLVHAQAFGPKGKGMRKTDAPELKVSRAAAPAGFDVAGASIPRGKIEPIELTTKSGDRYRAMVHLPPGFNAQTKLPTLYLLHGASGDENTWIKDVHADAILDNLYAARKLVPMIVVMPAMLSAAERGQAGDSRDAKARASMGFGEVLLNDLIPFVQEKYPVIAGRGHRALAGLSMGGGVAFSTGLTHSDQFAWIGAFSGSGSARRLGGMQLDLKTKEREPRLLWLSVGDRDGMMAGSMAATDAFLTDKGIPHEFHINAGGHEPKVWMNDLYHFAPLLFRP